MYSQSTAYRSKLENSWKSWLWLHWEKLLNTNPTSSFTPVRNVAAHITLAWLEWDWVAIAEQGAHMNSSKPYSNWLSLPVTNCLKHGNITPSHNQTLGVFFNFISSSNERYHFCLQAMSHVISWGHDFIVWEQPPLKIPSSSPAMLAPSPVPPHTTLGPGHSSGHSILGHREAMKIFNCSVVGCYWTVWSWIDSGGSTHKWPPGPSQERAVQNQGAPSTTQVCH